MIYRWSMMIFILNILLSFLIINEIRIIIRNAFMYLWYTKDLRLFLFISLVLSLFLYLRSGIGHLQLLIIKIMALITLTILWWYQLPLSIIDQHINIPLQFHHWRVVISIFASFRNFTYLWYLLVECSKIVG